jgi:hypothetical protein
MPNGEHLEKALADAGFVDIKAKIMFSSPRFYSTSNLRYPIDMLVSSKLSTSRPSVLTRLVNGPYSCGPSAAEWDRIGSSNSSLSTRGHAIQPVRL